MSKKKKLTGLIPLSAEEIAKFSTKTNDNKEMQLPMVLDKRRITVMEDPDVKWPELWLSVYVHGPEAGPNFNRMFARAKCLKADTPDDADLVVFSGSGHDVNPKLYGEKRHSKTYVDDAIDKSNLSLIEFCLQHGIPMVGVCGGAQILHVAVGGTLFQDVDGHNSTHTMFCPKDKLMIEKVSSIHHQLCDVNANMEVLGVAYRSTRRDRSQHEIEYKKQADIEAFFYREQCILGFQGHPEYSGYPKYTEWCLEQIDKYINQNPDLSYTKNEQGQSRLRMKEDLRTEKTKDKTITIPSEDVIIVEQVTGKDK